MSRTEGRVGDLRARVLERLKSRTGLTDELAKAPGVDGPDGVVPAWRAQREYDTGDPPGALVAISAVTASSERLNQEEEKSMTIQAVVNVRADVFGTTHSGAYLGQGWLDAITDEIAGELTTHDPPWRAAGQTGGTPEPLFDEPSNRWRAPLRFDVGRRD